MVDVLGLIFPKEKKFYSMLESQVENVTETSLLFYDLISEFSKLTPQKRKKLVLLIQKKERVGDEIYDKGVAELKATFITPMDREDIHRLIGRIDDVVDQLEIRALKIEAFKIKKIPRDLLELVNIFKGQVEDLSSCIYGLGKKKDINRYVLAVHEAERKADEVFIKGIAQSGFMNCRT